MRTIVVFIALVVFALLPSVTTAGPTITIFTDSDTYASGDTIEVSLSAKNFDEAMGVAVYVGLLGPDGDIYTLQFEGWSDRIEPWIPEIWVPCPFNMNRTPFWWFDVPCAMPPIVDQALYHFVAGLTRSGTFEFVCDISYAPFQVRYGPPTEFYIDPTSGDDRNDGSGSAPWCTITHALAAVTGTGDHPVTIYVAAGTYSASTNGEVFPLTVTDHVSICGLESQAEATVLDGEGLADYILKFYSVTGATIRYLTITGSEGGGIGCTESDPTIDSCIIRDNTNSASGWQGFGGAMHCYMASPLILNCTISGNYSASVAGAIYMNGFCCPLIQGCSFTENVTDYSGSVGPDPRGVGGAIFCEKASDALITDNLFAHNAAEYGGGAIYCWTSSPLISNNVITGNEAGGNGGGICCLDRSSPEIQKNTIADNEGGGIYCSGSGNSPTITDCIIWGNGNDLYRCSATYCCIEDLDAGEGNIHDDPTFVTGPFGEYYLHPTSPCIDAGSRSAEDAGLSDRTTQADGTPDTGTVDMGFHYAIP